MSFIYLLAITYVSIEEGGGSTRDDKPREDKCVWGLAREGEREDWAG